MNTETQSKSMYNRETQKQRNIKYRRKKNFVKKGYQFAQACGVDIIILTFDKKLSKFHEYYTTPEFKFEDARQIIDNGITQQKKKIKPVSIRAQTVFEKQVDKEKDIDELLLSIEQSQENLSNILPPQKVEQTDARPFKKRELKSQNKIFKIQTKCKNQSLADTPQTTINLSPATAQSAITLDKRRQFLKTQKHNSQKLICQRPIQDPNYANQMNQDFGELITGKSTLQNTIETPVKPQAPISTGLMRYRADSFSDLDIGDLLKSHSPEVRINTKYSYAGLLQSPLSQDQFIQNLNYPDI